MIYCPLHVWYKQRGPHAVDSAGAVRWHWWCLHWTNNGCIDQVTCGAEKCPTAAVNQAIQLWSSSGDHQGCHTAAYWFSHAQAHIYMVSLGVYVCIWVCALQLHVRSGPIFSDEASYLKSWEHWVCMHRGIWKKKK